MSPCWGRSHSSPVLKDDGHNRLCFGVEIMSPPSPHVNHVLVANGLKAPPPNNDGVNSENQMSEMEAKNEKELELKI